MVSMVWLILSWEASVITSLRSALLPQQLESQLHHLRSARAIHDSIKLTTQG
jgi:hypothetical protein